MVIELLGAAEAKSHGLFHLSCTTLNLNLNCWANKRRPMPVIMNMAPGIKDKIHCCLSENERIRKVFQSAAHGEIMWANVVFTSNAF